MDALKLFIVHGDGLWNMQHKQAGCNAMCSVYKL